MKPPRKETETDLKTKVLDFIQSQLDRNRRLLDQSRREAKLKNGPDERLNCRIRMLSNINAELSLYIRLWSPIDCSDIAFRASIEQLHISFHRAAKFYANPKIRQMGYNFYKYAHSKEVPDVERVAD